MCFEGKAQTKSVAQASHSCCKADPVSHCDSTGKSFGNTKGCCGMMGNSATVLASSDLQSNFEQLRFKVVALVSLLASCKSTATEYVACTNRAPPRLTGMGTSKTYLYKRTFLI